MIFGMSLVTYTLVHVAVSLVAILAGFIVVIGMLDAKRMNAWTGLFLSTTVATSVTGFGFPVDHLLPSQIVGGISLVVLAIAIAARYGFHLAGAARWVYVVGALMALYLNVFVLVVQSFLKVPALKTLAPTQSEPPFQAAQAVMLLLFIVLGIFTVKKFRNPT